MKKYALNNSYFKNRRANDPGTLSEIVSYLTENGELPFRYEGDNWPYDMVCERQKRKHIMRCQYLTPDATATRMARLAKQYTDLYFATDACCGTGQITRALLKEGFEVKGFDIDPGMLAVYNYLYPECCGFIRDIEKPERNTDAKMIVSNPPFDRQTGIRFFSWLVTGLASGGRAVLLLSKNYIDKANPKSLKESLEKLIVLHREDMQEKFFHTAVKGEIVVLEMKEQYSV